MILTSASPVRCLSLRPVAGTCGCRVSRPRIGPCPDAGGLCRHHAGCGSGAAGQVPDRMLGNNDPRIPVDSLTIWKNAGQL